MGLGVVVASTTPNGRSGPQAPGLTGSYRYNIYLAMTMRWSEAELRDALDEYEAELRVAGKARNTVNTYVQHPERFINWLVGRYHPTPSASSMSTGPSNEARQSRYSPLQDYLASSSAEVVTLSFARIEEILGNPLPASARRHRAWWANDEQGTHTHARSWLRSGRLAVNVDMAGEQVQFTQRAC